MASTLTGSSTLSQIETAYGDNGSYVEDDSVAKCRAFITACRLLLVKLPTVSVKGANSISFRVESLQRELERAQAWLETHSTTASDIQAGPRVTRSDFRGFRR